MHYIKLLYKRGGVWLLYMWSCMTFVNDFHIRDDRGNKIYDNALTLKLLGMHEGREEVYLYISSYYT
jgi:hypothetical protein